MIDVLFVCIHNSGRSQMAEAFFNALAPERLHAESAGTEPVPRIDPLVIEAMKEVGIDLTDKRPKPLTPAMITESARVITMGCGVAESCPVSLNLRIEEDWGLADPAGHSLAEIRPIRDAVRREVEGLLLRIG